MKSVVIPHSSLAGAESPTASFTPGNVLPRFQEPQGLHLFDEPITVSRENGEDGSTTFTMRTAHDPLDGTQLFKLLKHAAPSTGFDSIGGVVADWNIVDRQELSPFNKELVDMHERLGQPWAEFLKSRPAFLDAFNDSEEPYIASTGLPAFLRGLPLADYDLRYEALGRIATSFDAAVGFLEKHGVENAERLVFDSVRAAINSRRHKQHQLANVANVKASARKKDLIKCLGRLLPREALTSLEDYVYTTVADEQGNEYKVRHTQYDPKVFASDLKNRQTVTKGRYQADVVTLSKTETSGYSRPRTFVLPGSLQRLDVPQVVLSPLVKWVRDSDGSRRFIFDRQLVPGASMHHLDGVLGSLAVAYFAPEVTSEWPKALRIGKSREQQMGVAQLPVLALFPKFQQQLLSTKLIRVAEAAAIE